MPGLVGAFDGRNDDLVLAGGHLVDGVTVARTPKTASTLIVARADGRDRSDCQLFRRRYMFSPDCEPAMSEPMRGVRSLGGVDPSRSGIGDHPEPSSTPLKLRWSLLDKCTSAFA